MKIEISSNAMLELCREQAISKERNTHFSHHMGTLAPFLRAKGNAGRAQTATETTHCKTMCTVTVKEKARGFRGKTLRRLKTDRDITFTLPNRPQSEIKDYKVDKTTLGRLNHRNLTPIHNSGGLTRYEDLRNDDDSSITEVQLHGIFEDYSLNNCCKGKYHISDHRNYSPGPGQQITSNRIQNVEYTGFIVKSYQNPNPAQILASFPDLRRSRTFVPSFYTFSALSKLPSPPQSRFARARLSPRLFHSNTIGNINKLRSYECETIATTAQPNPSQSLHRKSHHPRNINQSVSFNETHTTTPSNNPSKVLSDPSQGGNQSMRAGEVGNKSTPMVINMKKADIAGEDGVVPPSPTIFVVEDEEGHTKKVDFEDDGVQIENDVQTNKLQRQESEEIMAVLKEHAEKRQKNFAQLLDEHKEIVQELGRISNTDLLVTPTQRN